MTSATDFVGKWLFESEERCTGGMSWTPEYVADAAAMCKAYAQATRPEVVVPEVEKLLDLYDEALLETHDDQLSRSGARRADEHYIEVRKRMLAALGISPQREKNHG